LNGRVGARRTGLGGKREDVAALAVLFLLGLVVRLWRIGSENLWFDEWFSLCRALEPLAALLRGQHLAVSPPLYYLLLKPWVVLFGDAEAVLRLPSALAGAAAVPLVAQVGRRLFDRATGLSAALLFAVFPYHVRYSQEARMYALIVLLGLLSVAFFLARRERETPGNAVGYVLSSAALLYTHYFGGFVLLAQGVVVVVAAWHEREQPRALLRWALDVAVVAVLFALWVPTLLRQLGEAPRALGWVQEYGATVARRVLHLLPWPLLLFLAAGIVAAVVAVLQRPRARRIAVEPWVLLLAWFLVPHLGLLVLSVAVLPLYVVRYAIVGLPAVVLGIAAAVRSLRPMVLQRGVVLAVAAGLLLLTVRASARADKPQWREALAWVAERAAGEDLVLVSGWESSYYVEREPRLRGGAVRYQARADGGATDGVRVDRPRVWYVQQLHWEVPTSLACNYVAWERQEFSQVAVTLFQKADPGDAAVLLPRRQGAGVGEGLAR